VQISAILAVGRAVTPAPPERTAASQADEWVSPHPDEGAVTPNHGSCETCDSYGIGGLFPIDGRPRTVGRMREWP